MLKFLVSLKEINKILLLVALISLAYKRGHFSGTLIPSPFQIFFVLSVILTVIYLLKNNQVKDFFLSVPKKILIAVGCLFFSVVIGWIVADFFVGIPTVTATILDFGTFTISIMLFFLISFYIKGDERYSKWYLYSLFIPNFYILYYFLTHGIVGYWGVLNDNSLNGIVDPNVNSKIMLIPALFFASMSLFSFVNKKWWETSGYMILSSLFSALIFWTVSRGSALSLILGLTLIWLIFSIREFTWKKFFTGGSIIFLILFLGYTSIPQGTKQEFYTKIVNTGSLPTDTAGIHIITTDELRGTPRSEVRILEWVFFIKYALHYPLGIGPSSSSTDYQNESYVQLRPGNTYLQIWLWGGILGIVSFLYILWSAFVALWIKWKKFFDAKSLALFGILFALSIAIIFDASLYFYWFFIILAVSLQKNEIENNQTEVQVSKI